MIDRSGDLWIGGYTGIWRAESGEHQTDSDLAGSSRSERQSHGLPIYRRWSREHLGDDRISKAAWFDFARKTERSSPNRIGNEMGVTLCVTADAEGALWVGTENQGLFRLRPRIFSTLAVGPDIEPNRISMITEAHDGSLWFSGHIYLWHWFGREICLFDTLDLRPSPYVQPDQILVRVAWRRSGFRWFVGWRHFSTAGHGWQFIVDQSCGAAFSRDRTSVCDLYPSRRK